jgi:hypothetical protein
MIVNDIQLKELFMKSLLSLMMTLFFFSTANAHITDLTVFKGESDGFDLGNVSWVQYPEGALFIVEKDELKKYSFIIGKEDSPVPMLANALRFMLQETEARLGKKDSLMVAEQFMDQFESFNRKTQLKILKNCDMIDQLNNQMYSEADKTIFKKLLCEEK